MTQYRVQGLFTSTYVKGDLRLLASGGYSTEATIFCGSKILCNFLAI